MLAMIMVPVGTFITILCIGYFTFSHTIETRTMQTLKRIVNDHRHMIESFLMERKASLEFVADSYTFDDLMKPKMLGDILERLQRESNAFLDIGVFNDSGVHVAYHGPYKLTGKNYSNEEWFKTVTRQGYYISDAFMGFRNTPHFIIAVTRKMNGHTWVLRATIDTYVFNDLVENIRIGQTGEAYIINAQSLFQTKRRSGGNLLEMDTDEILFPENDSESHTFLAKSKDGIKYLYAVTWMKDKHWLLVVRQEESDAFKTIRSAAYLAVLITLLGSIMIVGIAFYLTDRLVRRMEGLDTEKTQLNQQLIGASRLAELGEMAAGFAHEINNPLQIMKSEHSLIKMLLGEIIEEKNLEESEPLADIHDSLNQIELQISRCGTITQSILKFGRQGEPNPQAMDIHQITPEVVGMIKKKAFVQDVEIQESYGDSPILIHGDPPELQQVLLNLLNNAMDAIEDSKNRSSGIITVKTGRREDGTAKIEIADNGKGISPEDMNKIFTPFFTTKPVGKGTGLGLSVCFGIINKMGGTMEVFNNPEGGTNFAISLPVIQK
ncbi:MAG: ATP-binding protein [Proteobacteria bacterium]|nr:ATP-binding protein [Pseudomonadota bacterium]MBU4471927.1 ATP-binding protein [Pseudomonadota bacterium]